MKSQLVPFYKTLCYCPKCKNTHFDWWNQKKRYNRRNDVILPRVECFICLQARVGIQAAKEYQARMEKLGQCGKSV